MLFNSGWWFMKNNSVRNQVLGLLISSLLSACGGGGGGWSSVVDITGVASKGLINHGIVKAFAVNADGTLADKTIATTYTDDSGSYLLKDIPAGTAVIIEVTSDEKTQVIDENTGSKYTPTVEFKLRAATNTVAGSTNTVVVTPFSEMGFKRAQGLTGALNRANIESANQYIGDSTGVIVNSKDGIPKFDGDGKTPLNSPAAKLVAIAKMTNTTDHSVDKCSTLTALPEKTNCVVNELSAAATLVNLNPSSGLGKIFNDKLAAVKQENSEKTDVANASEIKFVENTGTASSASSIDQVMAFFDSLRSNAKALKDTSGTDPTLYTKLQDIQTDLQSRATPLNNYAENTISLIDKAHGLLQDAQSGAGIYTKHWDNIGGCKVYTDINLQNVAKSLYESKVVGCHTEGNLNGLYNYTLSQGIYYTRNETVTGITLVPTDSANSYTVISRTFSRTVTATSSNASPPKLTAYVEVQNSRNYLSVQDSTNGGYQATVKLTKDNQNNVTAIDWSGNMASSYNDAGDVLGKKHQINLNAQLSNLDSNTKKVSMAGDISLFDKSDQLVSKLSLDTGSYVTGSTNQNGQDEVLLKLSLSSPKWVIQGSLKGSGFSKDKQGLNYEATQLDFTGSVKDSSGTEFFRGSISGQMTGYLNFDKSLPKSATNFAPTTVSIKGTVSIVNRPTLFVDLNASNSAFDKVSGTLTYSQGNDPTVTMTVNRTAGSTAYTFANTQGIAMKWSPSDSKANLTKSDVTLGTWDFNSGRLTYIDNRFEQF
jgi:hypothetical protein